jgi:hypothetical protein
MGKQLIITLVPVNKSSLPRDPEVLLDMIVDLTRQLDKTNRLV